MELQEAIVAKIEEEGGKIPFSVFMEMCLYAPGAGYYQRARPKLGKEGDFYTSAHIGGVMGQCIASRLHKAACELEPEGGPLVIAEWGGGDGRLAEAVLDELSRGYEETYRRVRFLSVEGSPYHRELQRERLKNHAGKTLGIMEPDENRIDRVMKESTTLVFANELLDAFPVHRFKYVQGEWLELYVVWDRERKEFRERTGPISTKACAELLEREGIRGREGQVMEAGPAALHWIRRLSGMMRKGFVLVADYGDVSAELYAPHRMNGTLLAYRNHNASDEVYRLPGEQDLTAHVNFEWCMKSAREAGFMDVQLQTQKQFLVEQGILSRLVNHFGRDPFSPEARSNRAIRQLLISDGMSELFKVLTMSKLPREEEA